MATDWLFAFLDSIRPWFMAGFFTIWAIMLLKRKRRSFTVGEGIGSEEVAWLYWAAVAGLSLLAALEWLAAFRSL